MIDRRRNILGVMGTSPIDWESIARGMVDGVTEFELTDFPATMSQNYSYFMRAGLKKVIIAPTTTLGQAQFQGCSKLESVEFPNNLQNIQYSAFSGCGMLTTLTLPASVTAIGQYAFNNCRGLVSVILEPTTPPTISSGSWSNTTCSFYVPDASVNDYKAASQWSNLASRIKPISELGGVADNQPLSGCFFMERRAAA